MNNFRGEGLDKGGGGLDKGFYGIYDIINFIDHQYQSEPDLIRLPNYVFQLADLTAQTQARFTQASDEIHLKPHIKNKTNDNKL